MSYELEDFLRCPSHNCENPDPGLDYYFDGERIFFSFKCISCGYGALEDDFRWHVTCPNCLDEIQGGGVDRIDGEIEESGYVHFECQECGAKSEGFVNTRWDGEDSDPKFEPNTY